MKLRAPIPKEKSKTNTPAGSPSIPGVESSKTPVVEAAKVEESEVEDSSQVTADTEDKMESPTSNKENSFIRKKTRKSLKPPDEEGNLM